MAVTDEMVEAGAEAFMGKYRYGDDANYGFDVARIVLTAALSTRSDWPEPRPISEAPKDGTVILAYLKVDDETAVYVVSWWHLDGWQFTSKARDRLSSHLQPTHFWNLPPGPPTTGETR